MIALHCWMKKSNKVNVKFVKWRRRLRICFTMGLKFEISVTERNFAIDSKIQLLVFEKKKMYLLTDRHILLQCKELKLFVCMRHFSYLIYKIIMSNKKKPLYDEK